MNTATEKQAAISPREELVAFLKAEREALCAAWSQESIGLPRLAARYPDGPGRQALFERQRQLYDSIVAHLERPEAPVGGAVLPPLVQRYLDEWYPLEDILRTLIILKRLVIRGLVARYSSHRDALAMMCVLYESAIDETRIRAATLYYESDVIKHLKWEGEIRILSAVKQVTNAVISATSTDQIPQILFAGLREVLRYDLVIFGLLTTDGKQVECSCATSSSAFLEVVDAGEVQRFVMAECITRNEPIILGDIEADPSSERYPILKRLRARSCVIVPLCARGRVIGALMLSSSEKNVYSETEKNVLTSITGGISLAIQVLLLLATEKKRAAELEMLNAVGRIVTEHLDAKGLLEAAARAIQRTFSYYDVSFFLVDRAANNVVMTAQAGAFGELMQAGYRQPIGVGMVGWTAQHGQALIANDVSKEQRRIIAFAGEADCKSEMTVPIKVGENVVGVINVSSRQLSAFDERDRIALETIAQEIAKGIENARLFNQTRVLKELSEDIVSSIPLSLLVLDRDLRIVGFNPASLSNLGVAESALKGRLLPELVNDTEGLFLSSVQQAVQGGRLASFTGVGVNLVNRGRRVFNVWFSPTRSHMEGVGLLVLQDITQESLVEEEMRRVRKDLQAIMTHLPIGITATDMNGVYTHWSTGCERVFGYTAEEMVGKRTPLVLAKVPYDLSADLEECRRQRFTESERINVRKDGTEIWVHKVRVSLYDEAGKQIGYVSYLQDITQQRRAQEEVLREKQKLSEVVSAMGAGLALMDLSHKITWANKTLHDWLGGGHTVIGKDCFEVFHSESGVCKDCISQAAVSTGQMQKHSHTAITSDGQRRHFQHIMAPIRDREGHVTQLLVMLLDVTEHVERVNQIEILQQLGEQLQGVLELDRLQYLILTCVTAGEGLGFNRAVLMLADRERRALEGRMDVGPTSAEEAGRIWNRIRQEKMALEDFLEEYDQMSPEEQKALRDRARRMRFSLTETSELPVVCLLNKEPIQVSDAWHDPRVSPRLRELVGADQFVVVPLVARGQAMGVIIADNRFSRQPISEGLVRLLTTFASQAALSIANAEAYHRLEEQLQQLAEARDHLVRSERLAAIGTMATHVAHEIRNPLVTIGGFARSILRGADPSTPCGQHSHIIVDEVMRLEKILANVMNFTKPSPPHRTETDIDQILDQTCLMLAEACKTKNIELVKDFHLGGEKTLVDAGQMKQVFLNVIQNAVDSIEANGRIAISTLAEDNRVRIDIKDTGAGMTAEVQESVFLPFFTTKSDGSGLGLAVSRKIVEDHGGEMLVQSAVGAGTTFSILLPRLTRAT
jgi:hypothetical protein